MNRQAFLNFIESKGVVFLDGATGSNMQKAGMPSGVCPEVWMMDHPEPINALKKGYLDAGTQILYAPTFGGNRIKLEEYGYAGRIEEINTTLVQMARAQAGEGVLIAGDITMTGRQLAPMGDMPFEELIDIYKEQITILDQAGVDLLVVETMLSVQECRAALIAAKEVSDLAVMVTLTFEADGRTLFGNDPAAAALTLEALGAAAIGTNCGAGPMQMRSVVEAMADAVSIPVIAKPNAGLPVQNADGETVYPMDAETFAEEMVALVHAGARIVGGCCGTTPAHIKRLKERVMALPEAERQYHYEHKRDVRVLTSERKSLRFTPEDPFLIVGERINPTGKKKLQEALREGSLNLVAEYAEAQEADGASVLDINVGMGGIDEREMLLKVIEEVTQVTDLPLCIDTSDMEAMEAALRRYPGRALINSVSLEKGKPETVFPLAARYGAMVILLPIGEAGLPKNIEEKLDNVDRLCDLAKKYGLRKEDLVVDGLVATVAADPEAGRLFLETIRYCKAQGLATIGGLSNVSFGLPERGVVNAAFLAMAICEGLSMAIANPAQQLLMNVARASDLLISKRDADAAYLARIERYHESAEYISPAGHAEGAFKDEQKPEGTVTDEAAASPLKTVYNDILKGNRRTVLEDTVKALEAGASAKEILDEALMPAIEEVGNLFDQGRYFLPQLIAGAEAMKTSIAHLEPLLAEGRSADTAMPVIVIATVHGDIHDIGKNLVTLMLRNYGFQVHDLGKDVPAEEIIDKALEADADIIALSALMTTTMQEMEHVVALARERGVRAKIMVGGAVVTQDYADSIHADGYSDDAGQAVKVAQRILSIKA